MKSSLVSLCSGLLLCLPTVSAEPETPVPQPEPPSQPVPGQPMARPQLPRVLPPPSPPGSPGQPAQPSVRPPSTPSPRVLPPPYAPAVSPGQDVPRRRAQPGVSPPSTPRPSGNKPAAVSPDAAAALAEKNHAPGDPAIYNQNRTILLEGNVGEKRGVKLTITGLGPQFNSALLLEDGSLMSVSCDMLPTDKGIDLGYTISLRLKETIGGHIDYRDKNFNGRVLCADGKPVEIYANRTQRLTLNVESPKAQAALPIR